MVYPDPRSAETVAFEDSVGEKRSRELLSLKRQLFGEPSSQVHVPSHFKLSHRVTGWRINSEVLPLQWRQVDLRVGEVRLDPGTTKNREGRVFYLTPELHQLLKDQRAPPPPRFSARRR